MRCSVRDEGLVVDCANGVGGIAMEERVDLVPGTILVNAEPATEGAALNKNCGADFAQKARTSPTADRKPSDSVPDDVMWASLDGDADRCVYYLGNGDDNLILANGDRFAALAAQQVAYAVKRAGLEDVTIGVGQTAYSNGAATDYLLELPGADLVDSKTGVKHLKTPQEGGGRV